MIFKTLTLGLLSAVAAGSVMYFGTVPMDSGQSNTAVAEINPDKRAATPSANRATDSATSTIEVMTKRAQSDDPNKTNTSEKTVKRLPSLRDTIKDKRASRIGVIQSASVADDLGDVNPQTSDAQPKKRWLDQYLKRQKPDASTGTDTAGTDKDDALSMDNEQNSTELGALDMSDMQVELFEEPIDPPKTADEAMADAVELNATLQDQASTLNALMKKKDKSHSDKPRFFKIEDGVLVEVKRGEVEQGAAPETVYDRSIVSDDKILRVAFEEAARITKPELRDQAYFGIVEYALREGEFDVAELALKKIEQVEMNYTAKSRIAVAFAQKGLSKMAFETINSVDEPELRDFMRLQVIEAMIAPERLPSQWREDTRRNPAMDEAN